MNRNGSKTKARTVRVWSYDEAKKAVPYISAIMRSLREHCLESQSHKRSAQRLADKPGRPDRTALVSHSEEVREATEAQHRFDDGIAELHALDVFCLDPVGGEAVIPFLHAKKLAWFVFDLFDEEDHLRQWRYHEDPLDTRRPIADALTEPTLTA
jgi:hypothetical protein